MADPYIQDAKPFQYLPVNSRDRLELMGALESWEDDLPEDVAEHRILKRDGALQEPMGSGAGRFSFRCIYYGGQIPEQQGDTRSAYARYRELATFLRRNKRGHIIHPQLGKASVAYRGVSQASRPGTEGDAVIFTLLFAEDQLDRVFQVNETPGALGQQAAGDAAALQAQLDAKAASSAQWKATLAEVVTRVGTFYTLVSSFVDTAVAAANVIQQDPSLLSALGAVLGASRSLVSDMQIAGLVGVDLYPYTTLTRSTVAGCVNLYNAVSEAKARVERAEVRQTTNVQAFAADKYGGERARDKVQEILQLNPGLRNPAVIPAGTWLFVSVP